MTYHRSHARQSLISFVATCLFAYAAPAQPPLQVDSNFSSGSGEVIEINQQRRYVSIRPTPHEGKGWSCWWYFRLSGIVPGETITVEVGDAPWATPDQAFFSTDNRTWKQMEAGQRRGKRIAYRQPIDATAAWFAWGPPFTPEDAENLVQHAATQCEDAEAFVLCKTRAGRSVPAIKVAGRQDGEKPPVGIWIQARQHAWESGSSWVCRGFVDWLTSDDERAVSLRNRSTTYIVPVMDMDNVAIGAGGKNQTPHDHNRDWTDSPHWKSVGSAIEKIQELNRQHRFDLFVDLHNPGATSKDPFFYTPPAELLSDQGTKSLRQFLDAAQSEMTGPLTYRGQVQESGRTYDDQWRAISKNWVSVHCDPHVVAVTLETAWNTPRSTSEGYQTLGRQLGLAIEAYFRR